MRIEWTDRALTDLVAVYAYIAGDNEAAARRVIGEIRKTVDHLEMFPALGRWALGTRSCASWWWIST